MDTQTLSARASAWESSRANICFALNRLFLVKMCALIYRKATCFVIFFAYVSVFVCVRVGELAMKEICIIFF